MCKICGEPEGVHPALDAAFKDVPEYLIETLNRIGQYSKDKNTSGIEVSGVAMIGASVLAGVLANDNMPVAHVGPVEGGGLGLEWRSGNRALEIEVFPDGKTFEFLVAQIDPPQSEENQAELAYQLGSFKYDDLIALPTGDEGPSLLADWLLGGEFAESLDRYLYPDDSEGTCLASEPGSEPPNTADLT
jgi:hypothetical protein